MMVDTRSDWYTISNPEQIDTPAILVYVSRVKENIEKAVTVVKDPMRLRPHVKTNKSIEACQMMMEAGIRSFKCATVAEAEMLVRAGAKDILLAYQPVGPKQGRWLRLIQSAPEVVFSCLIDNDVVAQQLSDLGQQHNLIINAYLDLNAGTNRTGISTGEAAENLFLDTVPIPSIRVKGFHVYDGHLRQTDIKERTKACDEGYAPVLSSYKRLRALGHTIEVIAGGSTTFTIHAAREETVCSPGTFVYWDKGYGDGLPEQPFIPAALVITRVISLPAPGLVCLDLGHKSIAAENPLANRVSFLNAPGLTPISQSEEHLVLETAEDHSYKVGDLFYGIPYHICPTVALHERVFTVADGKQSGEWKVAARDKRLTF